MKRAFLIGTICLAASILAGCEARKPKVAIPPTRETIAIKFAAVDLEIHDAANDTAPVLSRYRITEPVSIVSEKEGWSEVKISLGKYGWVHTSDLVADKHEVGSTEGNIRMRIPPEKVEGRARRGSAIWLKASVNAFGDVTDIRTYQNSTGKPDLLDKHIAALRKAKLYPMMDEGGSTKPFIYDYKVVF